MSSAAMRVFRRLRPVRFGSRNCARLNCANLTGLPVDVPSAVLDYVVIGDALTVGASRSGALAGWTFSDADHQAWMADPAFRFLDHALSCPEPDRTMLQGRALLAISLLSQGCPTSPTSNCSIRPWPWRFSSVRRPTGTRSSGSPAESLTLLWMARPALPRHGPASLPAPVPAPERSPPGRARDSAAAGSA
jgi:hypothetical protein